MDDEGVMGRIEELVSEEHRLLEKGDGGELSDDDHARLKEVQVGLDRCWDLLRQRRALREFGRDPGEASERDEGTVEGYLN
jgi:uncharacterized protein DUF2630